MADDGRAYGRAAGTSDPELTEVAAGTPAGELLRRYWHPVARSDEATARPREVRILGEDLVLYRSLDGVPGLLTPRCCHRGTTLYYGKVEAEGIRCPYHGWLFAEDGRCLDQPCEPDRGRNRDSYRQPWYPVVEYHGLVFAYLGPADRQPVFPRYDIFEDLGDDEEIVIVDHFAFGGPTDAPCNWFQTHENAMDPYHVFILHNAISGPQFDPRLDIWPRIDWQRDELGVTATQDRDLPDGTVPAPRHRGAGADGAGHPDADADGARQDEQPVVGAADRRTTTPGCTRWCASARDQPAQGLPVYDGDRTWFELSEAEHQRFPGDYETQVGQGPITLHSEERLATSDRGVSMVRRQFREQVRRVADGPRPRRRHVRPGRGRADRGRRQLRRRPGHRPRHDPPRRDARQP